MKRKQITIIGVVISVLIITVIVMAVNLDRSAIIETILTGVVSSILASIVFYVFSKYVFQDNSDEKEKLDKAIEKTREIYGFALNSQLGILKIEKRSGYNTDFWRKFLQGTKNRCIISGRTLNRWLKKEIRDEFIETLKRLIKNNGEIVFVIYKISEGLKEKEEKENLKKFLNKEIFPYIYKKEKSHSRKS